MSKELEEKALPGYKSLADTQREQNLQTQNMISQNEIIILLLDRICTLKENQNQDQSDRHESGSKRTLIQILLGCTAVYLGIIDINKDNAIVIGFTDALLRLLSVFP